MTIVGALDTRVHHALAPVRVGRRAGMEVGDASCGAAAGGVDGGPMA